MLNQGNTVPIFLLWQTEEKLLGKAILKEKIKDGYNFILDDLYDVMEEGNLKIPESLTPVYSFQRWRVQFIECTPLGSQSIKVGDIRAYNIRYIHNIGISRSSEKKEDSDDNYIIKDKFLTIGGIEVF